MVDRAELFAVADAIVAEGQEPSHRLLSDRMSGSFSDVGPLLIEWRMDRKHFARPHRDHLPDHLRDKLATVASEIWLHGLRERLVVGQNERDALVVERDALRMSLKEMLAKVEELNGRLKLLEGDGGRGGPVKQEARYVGKPVAPEGSFWDGMMQEIVVLLGDRKLSPAAILKELSEETVNEAARRDKAWSKGPAGRLAHKMRSKGRFFMTARDGLFSRHGLGEASVEARRAA